MLAELVHIYAYSIWVGVLLWVTFISGIIMLKNMPPQLFGKVQSKLFPWYFGVGLLCESILLVSSVANHPHNYRLTDFGWVVEHAVGDIRTLQTVVLLLCWVLTLVNMVFVGPLVSSVMFTMHKAEADKNETLRAQLKKRFGMLHGISSLINLLIIIGALSHGYFLAKKLSL